MRKGLKLFFAVAMVVALATPAMAASVDMTGFYRAKGYMTNFFQSSAGDFANGKVTLKKDAPTASYIDQRWRGKIVVGDENVKAVTHLEINGKFGSTNADLSGDSTSAVAVKNLYLWFKPMAAVDVTVGLQGMSDPYQGFMLGAADAAGIVTNVKAGENLGLKFGYLAPFVTSSTFSNDESNTFYLAEAALAPSKDVKVGASLYFWRDGRSTTSALGSAPGITKLYIPGVNFAVNAGPVGISGFVLGQFGDRTHDNAVANPKVKSSGYAADLRADLAAGPAKIFLEGVYVSGDKANTPDKYKGFVVLDDIDHGTGCSTFNRNDMVLLTPAADSIGTAGALTYNLSNDGQGAMHLAAGAKMEVAPKTTLKVGLGYLAAAQAREVGGVKGKKDMGTEINLMVNYNLMKGLDLGFTGAYAMLGKYFTDDATGTVSAVSGSRDADDPYALIAKVNYAY